MRAFLGLLLLVVVVEVRAERGCGLQPPECRKPANPEIRMSRPMMFPCLLDRSVRAGFEQKARQGEPGYAEWLWIHFRDDLGENEAGQPWLLLAARQGHAYSQFTLGSVLLESAAKDKQKVGEAFDWMERAAKTPSRTFSYQLGLKYRDANDNDSAIKWLQFSARLGNQEALHELLGMYRSQGMNAEYCAWRSAGETSLHLASDEEGVAIRCPEMLTGAERRDVAAKASKLAVEIVTGAQNYERQQDRCTGHSTAKE